jgi:hypothetical protein
VAAAGAYLERTDGDRLGIVLGSGGGPVSGKAHGRKENEDGEGAGGRSEGHEERPLAIESMLVFKGDDCDECAGESRTVDEASNNDVDC